MLERRALSVYETGLVATDGLRHAAARKLTGHFAVCGAGRIVVPLAARFRTTDADACGACADLTSRDETPDPPR